MSKEGLGIPSELWARFRFSVVGRLLASPPEAGELQEALREIAGRWYRHPVTCEPVRFGFSTLERWYYEARNATDPITVLRRKVRSDAGSERAVNPKLLAAIEAQYRQHPTWSRLLHQENIKALVEERPDLGPAPSYATVRRCMNARGWWKRRAGRRRGGEETPGQKAAAERLEKWEVRSYEASCVGGLWHLDFHHASLRVVDSRGVWHTPKALAILDDRSRLCCHMQWYLQETAEVLIHGLCQAFAKRGLPRSLLTDNGAAMIADETTNGLSRLGIVHDTTLPHSPYQNGKQEAFWGPCEGRLMAMLEDVSPLTLDFLNRATQAWVEVEYNRKVHSETGEPPIERMLKGPDVLRPCPPSEALRLAFTVEQQRTQRRSDGTISLDAVRFEIPSRLRTLSRVHVRYQTWDKTVAYVVDGRTGHLLARVYPVDKTKNADGRRRSLAPIDGMGVVAEAPPAAADPIPPLMRKILAEYAATGLPPAYIPKDEHLPPADTYDAEAGTMTAGDKDEAGNGNTEDDHD
jgi:transposase InsO family protein